MNLFKSPFLFYRQLILEIYKVAFSIIMNLHIMLSKLFYTFYK